MPGVTVNGRRVVVEDGASVADLVEELVVPPGHLVVERNREILPPERYADTRVEEGDVYELLRFVGGG